MTFNINSNMPKLEQLEFYHISFMPDVKPELSQLPILCTVNDKMFVLIDLAQYCLYDLPPELIKESHNATQVDFICDLIRRYPHRVNSKTMMLVCKFSKFLIHKGDPVT